jgi:ferredoxin-type protein NapG
MSEAVPARRRFFKELIAKGTTAVADAASELVQVVPPRRRPPGAIDELTFLAKCTACGDCVKACPHHAIFTLASHVHPGAGTPVMVPDDRACHMCEDFPCVTACTPGVLLTPTSSTMTLGGVRIRTDRCFVFRGPECGACAGLCPGDLRALTLAVGRPRVDLDLCVGCGLCIAACPTMPPAIELIPLDERGAPSASREARHD